MASLFTNVSAMTALQTLSSVSKNLSDTQNRISTGLRINTASDNAAYWSIATTLRSDVGALGAVSDALGLGAATVDTVYTGLNNSKDLLNQIKAKLVAATQPGVPREQIQAEIGELQNRLKDGSSSTVINSESWLTQDSGAAGYNNIKSVVGSFTRANGAVTIDTINIDISKTKLYENNTQLHTDTDTAATAALSDYSDAVGDADVITDALAKISANLGTSLTTLVTDTTVAQTDIDAIAPSATGVADAQALLPGNLAANTDLDALITAAFGATDGPEAVKVLTDDQKTALRTALNTLGTDASTAIADATADGTAIAAGEEDGVAAVITNYNTAVAKAFSDAFSATSIKKTASDIVSDARDAFETTMAANTPNQNLGIFDKVRAVVSDSDGTNAKAISVSNIDISELTDTDFDKGVLQAYVQAVDDALSEVTLSASVLGASKSRIEGNQTFVKALVDANNRGIGQLVDADLNEESTKLKALQTQQQLAVQSLSIANSSSDSILQLFR